MTLQQYIDNLNKLASKSKAILDLEVIYSVDDEGNHFQPVLFMPQLMKQDDGQYKLCIN